MGDYALWRNSSVGESIRFIPVGSGVQIPLPLFFHISTEVAHLERKFFMSALFIILSILFAFGCVGLVSAILLQKKRSAGGIGSIAGMGNVADTYWDKNKRRSAEGTLETWTKLGAIILAVLAVILCLI